MDLGSIRHLLVVAEHLGRLLHTTSCETLLSILAEEIVGALDQPVQSNLYADALGMTIAMRLLKAHSAKQSPSWNSRPGGLAPWQISRSTEALAGRLGGEPSLDELAALVGLSKFHFLRAFKISIGMPPHRYLVDLRIARARDLLESTDLSVTEIAAQVGYNDPGYLARLFRTQVGTTPASFRRERRS
jgi:AraC family transcriptional regulator